MSGFGKLMKNGSHKKLKIRILLTCVLRAQGKN